MHGTESLIWLTDSDYIFCHLNSIAVLCVKTSDECVSITLFYHRHTEVVALVHFIISFLEAVALASTLLCQMLGKLSTAALFVIGTHIYNLNI